MKAAILGTEDYHTTMREIADSSLRYRMSYVPPRTNPDSPHNPLPPVQRAYLERVDALMQSLGNDDGLSNCNQRSLYLMLAWLLIGSDNEYRICQYTDNVNIPKQVAIIHIRIALGDTPLDKEIEDVIRAAKGNNPNTERDITWVARSATWAAANAVKTAKYTTWAAAGTVKVARATGVADGTVRFTITTKARQWAHISDEQAFQIARQLAFDILNL